MYYEYVVRVWQLEISKCNISEETCDSYNICKLNISHFTENEYSKSLTKLANGLRNSVVKEVSRVFYFIDHIIFCIYIEQHD